MKKIFAIFMVLAMVLVLIGATTPEPVKEEFLNEKQSIKIVNSNSNKELKESLTDFVENTRASVLEKKVKIKDSFLKVTGNEIILVTLEKVSGEDLQIKRYEITCTNFVDDKETELAQKISNSMKYSVDDFSYYMSLAEMDSIRIFLP